MSANGVALRLCRISSRNREAFDDRLLEVLSVVSCSLRSSKADLELLLDLLDVTPRSSGSTFTADVFLLVGGSLALDTGGLLTFSWSNLSSGFSSSCF